MTPNELAERIRRSAAVYGPRLPWLEDAIAETVEAARLAPAPNVVQVCPCGKGDHPWHWPRGGVCAVGADMAVR